MLVSTSMPTFMMMAVPYFANSARECLKIDASQILTRTCRSIVIVKDSKPESPSSERGANNHYRTTAQQIRNAKETVKL